MGQFPGLTAVLGLTDTCLQAALWGAYRYQLFILPLRSLIMLTKSSLVADSSAPGSNVHLRFPVENVFSLHKVPKPTPLHAERPTLHTYVSCLQAFLKNRDYTSSISKANCGAQPAHADYHL